MRIIDKLINFLRRYMGVMFILGGVTFAGVAVWMLVDKTQPVTAGQRVGSAAVTLLFAVLAWRGGRKILAVGESESAAYRRRQRMLEEAAWTDWEKYVRKYAAGDKKTLEEALRLMWNTKDIQEFLISCTTARECLQIFEKARQAGMPVGVDYDLSRLEDDKRNAIDGVMLRALTEATGGVRSARTRAEKQKWIDWCRQGMEELRREEAQYINEMAYNRIMESVNSMERSVY